MTRITRLLIANRGEIARRVIRTAQRLGIETVAVYSDADAKALHVREATKAVALGGNAASETYLSMDKLLAAAHASGADAVHPGYGFLSESAAFGQAVSEAGLTWVGPPTPAMRLLGNKAAARQLAQSLGVPTLPGCQGEDQSPQRFAAEARRIGFPVIVKAAAGGGGRGMRLVRDAAGLPEALAAARSEAQAAFGSGELLLERALAAPRHVEVQVFADAHGHCIHLGERDCSIQRRHQKLLEETPSAGVDAALRARMERCAVQLAQAAGYVGAGTVEFLVDRAAFFLMEVNTRLQVEHPVTEAVTGLDLVEWQLRIAQGEPLPLAQEQVRFAGHAIEARLCAEDEDFHPHTGRVRRFREPGGVRFDHAIVEGLEVTPFYDSMLGKLVVHAATREAAIERLAAALDETQLLGVPSNRWLLAACLRHPDVRAGRALIPFLAERGDELRAELRTAERELLPDCVIAALYGPGGGAAPSLPCAFARPVRVRHRGEVIDLRARPLTGGGFEVEHDGEVRRIALPAASCCPLDERRWQVQCGAVDLFLQDASFEPVAAAGAATAGELRAPFNGKVMAVAVQSGQMVARGETLVVLESMKLEHALGAPRDGVIKSVHVAPGQQAATEQVLITFEAAT